MDKGRQERPHAHSINVSPDNRFAIAADLGTDELKVYKLDAATGKIEPNEPPSTKIAPGAGPRHFAFHPSLPVAYVIAEMGNTVTELKWNAQAGTLQTVEAFSTLPPDYKKETYTAEVQVHPSGKWLYGSNRGMDTIAVFTIDKKTGKLNLVQNEPTRGSFPAQFPDRSHRQVAGGGQPEGQQHVGVPDRPEDRAADGDGRSDPADVAGVREVRSRALRRRYAQEVSGHRKIRPGGLPFSA